MLHLALVVLKLLHESLRKIFVACFSWVVGGGFLLNSTILFDNALNFFL